MPELLLVAGHRGDFVGTVRWGAVCAMVSKSSLLWLWLEGGWVGGWAEPRANELAGAPGSGPEATGPSPTSALAYFRSGSPLSFCLPLVFSLCADTLSLISIDFPFFAGTAFERNLCQSCYCSQCWV